MWNVNRCLRKVLKFEENMIEKIINMFKLLHFYINEELGHFELNKNQFFSIFLTFKLKSIKTQQE